MLRDQTWPQGFSRECWVLALIGRLVNQEADLAYVVHDHVLELNVAHVSLLVVQDAQLGERAECRYCALLVTQALALRGVGQRVLHSLLELLLAGLSARLSDVIVVHVRVETCVDDWVRLAIESRHFRHDTLLEHFIEHLGVLDLEFGLLRASRVEIRVCSRGCHRLALELTPYRFSERLIHLSLHSLLDLILLVQSAF